MLHEDILVEASELINDGQDSISEEKKVVFDKKTKQVSIKLPKRLTLKKGIKEDTIFEVVYNPDEKALEKAKESKFILFPKEKDI